MFITILLSRVRWRDSENTMLPNRTELRHRRGYRSSDERANIPHRRRAGNNFHLDTKLLTVFVSIPHCANIPDTVATAMAFLNGASVILQLRFSNMQLFHTMIFPTVLVFG